MESGKIAGILQPAKFLLMILQVITISVIIKIKEQHIYAGIPFRHEMDSDPYKKASTFIDFWSSLCLICLFLEFLIIFFGKTLFNSKYNITMIGLHIVGLLLSLTFLLQMKHYKFMRMIWIFTSGLPLLVETMSLIFSKMNYRNTHGTKYWETSWKNILQ